VIQAFKEVDHIIHAGDIACLEVLETLASLAPVTAVSGNIDSILIQEALGKKNRDFMWISYWDHAWTRKDW
jgi:hypothetical protein